MTPKSPTPATSELRALIESIGCVWSIENEAWVFSRYGMGLTSQIEPHLLEKLLQAIAEALEKEAETQPILRPDKAEISAETFVPLDKINHILGIDKESSNE